MGRREEVWRKDEGAEGVVCGGGEECGAVGRPLGAFEVVAAFVLGLGFFWWVGGG